MTTNDGGAAFPIAKALAGRDGETRKMEVNEGFSKLEAYALAAMQGLLANPNTGPESADSVIAASWRAAEMMLSEYERRTAPKEGGDK